MNTSQPPAKEWISDATALRYFALADRTDLLVASAGGRLVVPRQVLDPAEDPNGPEEFLSELGRSARYWSKRPLRKEPSAMRRYSLLASLRSRVDLQIADLAPNEQGAYATLMSRRFAREIGLRGPLASGEAAVIALAERRDCVAIIDEADGRKALSRRAPNVAIMTTLDVLKRAVEMDLVPEVDGRELYQWMRDESYWGPDWDNR